MKKSVIFMKNHSLIYDNKEYALDEIMEGHMISKYLKIIILEEMLYIKTISLKSKIKNLEEYISNKITEIFPENNEILYDYEKNYNKNFVHIYSIKGRDKMEKLCRECVGLEIIPMQFVIRDSLKKILDIKKESYMAFTKFDDRYYFIECSNGAFVDNYVADECMKVQKYLKNKNLYGKLFIDKKCYLDEYFLNKAEIIQMDFVGLLN